MTLRTPRRRISPRAKRRYKAIREFFRRALGSSSQQDIKINSSIAVNVTDLKHKIVGIESQLNEVNRHCRDLTCLENDFRKEAEHLLPPERQHPIRIDASRENTETSSERKSKSSDTKVLYKNTDTHYNRKSDESDYACNFECNHDTDSFHKTLHRNMDSTSYNEQHAKIKNKKSKLDKLNVHECDRNLRKHRAQSNYENFTSGYSTSSFHSLARAQASAQFEAGNCAHRRDKRHSRHREYIELPVLEQGRHRRYREEMKKKLESPTGYEEKRSSRKNKDGISKLDQEFIADIIKRQYNPIKLFGRRQSELSQFSAPVCRDQEFTLHEDIQEGSELCSCCYEGHKGHRYLRNHDLSDMRSICDTRLYSSKRHRRNKHLRRHVDIYNDSDLYDLIPVKEKSSPKTRRKFVESYMIPYNYYKEVPPSPRTQRPRLNLKAQYYTEYDDYMVHVKQPNRRYMPIKQQRHQELVETLDSDMTSEIVQCRIRKDNQKQQKAAPIQNPPQTQQDMGTMSSLQYPAFVNEQNNVIVNETTMNKTQDTDSSFDKTDKALCEIKDILQNFLQEIKKDSTPSQCDKSDVTPKTTEKQLNGVKESTKTNTGLSPNSGHGSFNNYNSGQCLNPPFMSPFANPCCYPIMPLCPMNCMQSGYVVPSPSFTCQPCATTQKEIVCQECSKNKKEVANETFDSIPKSNETEELIREIYKFVAQSPNSVRKKCQNNTPENFRKKEAYPVKEKVLTSRSVGGSSRASRRDAQVGTPAMKCYSKSCEAIGSRITSDTYYTNATQSDTILEKLSLEVTQSDSELSSDSNAMEKNKKSKFKKVLRSLGLFKKKKKDAIEELSESESSLEVDIKPKHSPKPSPYRQDITNYVMHGQEYYHRPPVPLYQPRTEGPYGYAPHGYDPRSYPYPTSPPIQELYTPHRVHQETIHEHAAASHYRAHPTAPPYQHTHQHSYEPHCSHTPQQVPLCLKEIEVQSTGTQSERKMSFFRKLAKGPPPRPLARRDPLMNNSTQTAKDKEKKPGLLAGFKHLQEKIEADPMKFSYKTQQKLAEGDMKMRNAFIKKMFYKRNPFSPRNLIMKTIMGNDPSSYGEPRMKLRPRLFM